MIFIPNIGKLLITNGNNAQCIAHAMEVAIPQKSQFAFIAIRNELEQK